MKLQFEPDDLEILEGIVEESTEHLNGIEEGVLKLEAEFAPEHLDHVFRALHSVKGVAGFVDYTPIKDTAHVLESFLSDMKKGLYEASSEITDLLLRGIDILNLHVAQLAGRLPDLEAGGGQNLELEIEEYGFQDFVDEAEAIRKLTLQSEPARESGESPVAVPKKDASCEVERVMKLEIGSFLEQSRIDFIEEVYEHLDTIEKNCVEMEKDSSNKELLNAILRGFHSIKGGAGVILSMMESDGQEDDPFYTIKNLTHTVESLLQTYRNMDLGIPSGVVDIILEAVDRSHALAKAIEEDRQEQIVIEDLVQKLQVFSSEENFLPAEGQALVEESNRKLPKQLTAFANITRQGLESISFLVNSAKPGLPVSNKRINQYQRAMNAIIKSARQMEYLDIAELVEEMQAHVGKVKPGDSVDTGFVDELKQQYEVLQSLLDSRIKDIADLCSVPEREYDKKLGEILLAENKITAEDLEQALKEQRKLGEVLVEKGILKKEDVDLALAKQSMARQQGKESLEPAQAASEVGGQSIRVSQDKMNRLMNMIGELLISKNRIFHLADQINLEYEIPELSRDVKSVAFEISRISDELQDAIMSARMLPLRVLFQRYPRTIRDTARKVGKQADLVVSGEETELDKTVMEAINDPLVHMLRNAVDHGIEPPDVRRALGKPEAGTVWLQARYQGNNVVIEIKDDGKGMDPDEIKAKALKKGLITTEQIETLSMDDTFRLIFAPGFSTRDEVSELSGRGVGMDVVKNNIEKVGGSIAMSSAVNAGSHFTLKIPLSMSIIRGLMIRCGGQQYVIPLDSIEETVKILPSDIRRYKDLLVADIRGGILHLVRLQDILDLEGREPQADSLETAAGPERISVVILENDGHRFGLIVDSFYKEQEFVVKALVEELAQLRIYTGASILGDGNVVLILNPAQLFNTFLHSRKAGEADGDNHSAG